MTDWHPYPKSKPEDTSKHVLWEIERPQLTNGMRRITMSWGAGLWDTDRLVPSDAKRWRYVDPFVPPEPEMPEWPDAIWVWADLPTPPGKVLGGGWSEGAHAEDPTIPSAVYVKSRADLAERKPTEGYWCEKCEAWIPKSEVVVSRATLLYIQNIMNDNHTPLREVRHNLNLLIDTARPVPQGEEFCGWWLHIDAEGEKGWGSRCQPGVFIPYGEIESGFCPCCKKTIRVNHAKR